MSEADAGARLDVYLARLEPDTSRSRLKAVILAGGARVNGRPARPARILKPGDVVTWALPAPAPPGSVAAEAIELDVVYEDEALLVVNKAAGMVVHPAGTVRAGTLVNALAGRGTPLSSLGAPWRPGIVHRLDKGTSGLLIVAKTDASHLRLARAIMERRVRREYWALVWGRPRPSRGALRGDVGRDPRNRTRMAVRAGGKPALTHYETLRDAGWSSVLRLRLDTGRTHQIRVHLAHAGHPVFGDATYGGRRAPAALSAGERRRARAMLAGFDRPALHAERLAFAHPLDGRELEFAAPLPPDLARLREALEAGMLEGNGGSQTA